MAEIVQLVGKSALGEPDKVTLEVANIIKNDYLQQNGISEYDQYCPFYKTSGMLRNMVDFHDKAQAAIANNPDMTWSKIKEHCSEIIYGLTQQKVRFSQREREFSESPQTSLRKSKDIHTDLFFFLYPIFSSNLQRTEKMLSLRNTTL